KSGVPSRITTKSRLPRSLTSWRVGFHPDRFGRSRTLQKKPLLLCSRRDLGDLPAHSLSHANAPYPLEGHDVGRHPGAVVAALDPQFHGLAPVTHHLHIELALGNEAKPKQIEAGARDYGEDPPSLGQ